MCVSEDSSETTFLLVENYQLTASVGLRIGREFLATISFAHVASTFFFIRSLALIRQEPGEEAGSDVVVGSREGQCSLE